MTSSFFWGHVGVGYSVLLFLTVPCAIKKINNNKLFWYARQLYFILFALLNIFKDKLI